tara:strand:- start:135809 stop:136054 length:246 start_codon:yes stop_codon:yes gene_type:complete
VALIDELPKKELLVKFMYEQNIQLIRELIQRQQPVYGILSFLEDTIGAIRSDITPDAKVASYEHLSEMVTALEALSKELFD